MERWGVLREVTQVHFDRAVFWGKNRGRFVIGMFPASIADAAGKECDVHLLAHYCYYRRVNMPEKHSWQPLTVVVPEDQGDIREVASGFNSVVIEYSTESERNGIIERFPDPFAMEKMKRYFQSENNC